MLCAALFAMHGVPFLAVFDMNESLKFAKSCIFEEGNITATGTYMLYHFWTNISGITSNLVTMLLIDQFCCITYAVVPWLLLLCTGGSPRLSGIALFQCEYFPII